jgi:hypothetical protein
MFVHFVTNTAISFSHPDWVFGFDDDPGMASATREPVLDMAVQDKVTLIGYRLAFPGIGNVAKSCQSPWILDGNSTRLASTAHGSSCRLVREQPGRGRRPNMRYRCS